MSHNPPGSLRGLIASLPKGVAAWSVVYQARFHRETARRLAEALPIRDLLDLDAGDPAAIASTGASTPDDVGFLELLVRDRDVFASLEPAHPELAFVNELPMERLRLCADVTDTNVDDLFAEGPDELGERCAEVLALVRPHRTLTVEGGGTHLDVAYDETHEWAPFDGSAADDYLLPSGEVASSPASVTGTLDLDGWAVGSLPFGLKYGQIGAGDAVLTIADGTVVTVAGANARLCADLELAFARLPGLTAVTEIGIGLNHGVHRAARRHEVGYLWHEKRPGVHVGMGAELPEFLEEERTTAHHLDVVLRAGRVRAGGTVLLEWD